MTYRLLDLFCGAGGASVGYAQAGFDVVGVDIAPQPRYPYEFHQADALDVLTDTAFLALFDVITASPPCQLYSRMSNCRDGLLGTYPDLIAPTRELLLATGKPYVIENVPGAEMRADLTLCGSMFDLGVRRGDAFRPLRRHRLFESNVPLGVAPSCDHSQGRPLGVYGTPSDEIPQGGQTCSSVREAGELMGIDWMTRWNDIKEAIPPAYTRFVGSRLLAALDG